MNNSQFQPILDDKNAMEALVRMVVQAVKVYYYLKAIFEFKILKNNNISQAGTISGKRRCSEWKHDFSRGDFEEKEADGTTIECISSRFNGFIAE